MRRREDDVERDDPAEVAALDRRRSCLVVGDEAFSGLEVDAVGEM